MPSSHVAAVMSVNGEHTVQAAFKGEFCSKLARHVQALVSETSRGKQCPWQGVYGEWVWLLAASTGCCCTNKLVGLVQGTEASRCSSV